MQFVNRKTMAIFVALFLTLTLAIPLVTLRSANAQATKNTFPLIGSLPNPVGVGQETLITTGLTHATAWPQPGWYGVTVTVTKPDGTTETLGPVTTDTTGITGITYVPNQVGTYYLETNFPEQAIEYTAAGTPAGTIMKASTSEKFALIVTQEPRQYYPGVPLPNEYWNRPINTQFREWEPIAGNWLSVDSYLRVPVNNDDAPETAHILWNRVLAEGGLVGGVDLKANDMNDISYEHGDAYEGKWQNPVIMNGVLFYNRQCNQYMVSALGSEPVEQEVVAVNIHTGEELWTRVLGNNERLSFGQIFYWQTMNMYGAFSYLWTTVGSTWNAYDPATGRWEYSIANVPSGTTVIGPRGELLRYYVNSNQGYMRMWNSTSVVWKTYREMYLANPAQAAVADYYAGRWRPHGITFNGTVGIDWQVSIPTGLPGGIQTILGQDRIIGGNTNWAGGLAEPNPVFWALSIKPGQEGRLIFNRSWPLPVADLHVDLTGSEPASLEDGIFVVSGKETRTHWGLSIDTGEQVWGPTSPPEPYLNVFTNLYMNPWGQAVMAYGKLYTAGMGGVVNAYDAKTGTHLWRYNITDPYTEQLFSENWPSPIGFITDGKIYLFHQEHSANTPMPRGAPTVCLDAETGEEVWRINGLRMGTRWGGQPIIADSIIVGFSSYDNRIVAVGKGPSATTVAAAPKSSTFGNSVVLEGMVTDLSPGTQDSAIMMRFPNGVAAVADESMSEWMKYVYMQFPRPMDTVGVDVSIDVLDANGNYRNVGTAKTDSSGYFSFVWKPDIPGKYTVIASFMGSKAYYGSFAETAFNVDEAPPATATPEPFVMPPTDMYILYATIVIVIAIVLVGILLLRKK